ncbi:MAG TPA: hypothetical protein VH643_35790, partial [Gemmataceae bacterium]
TIAQVPQGEVRVAVTSLAERPRSSGRTGGAGHGRVASPAATYSRIPMRYGDLAQSGLMATIAGDTVLDLDLK